VSIVLGKEALVALNRKYQTAKGELYWMELSANTTSKDFSSALVPVEAVRSAPRSNIEKAQQERAERRNSLK
jgi:hypothetical protein